MSNNDNVIYGLIKCGCDGIIRDIYNRFFFPVCLMEVAKAAPSCSSFLFSYDFCDQSQIGGQLDRMPILDLSFMPYKLAGIPIFHSSINYFVCVCVCFDYSDCKFTYRVI